MPKRLTTEEFIARAKEVHGNKYDYSLVRYKNKDTKIKIKCLACGNIFEVTPHNHILGKSGCPYCSKRKKKNTEEFIREARKIHGNKYDYSLVEYKNNRTKVKIICPKHSIFEQTPTKHLQGEGCPARSRERIAEKRRNTKEVFIRKAIKVHGNKYDYSLVEYKNAKTKVKIICKKCGNIFIQSPSNHLAGYGCPICGKKKVIEKRRKSTLDFIQKAIEIHGNSYDYSLVKYINCMAKVKIICKSCGRIFEQMPIQHLRGEGCPYCSFTGFNKGKPAILYYIKIHYRDRVYYKIGVTNRSVKKRFTKKDLERIKVLKVWKYEIGEEAYSKEQEILKRFKNYIYKGRENILESHGNKEVFIYDVLGFDKDSTIFFYE